MLFNHAYWNVNRIGISVDECTLKGINVDHALCGSIGSRGREPDSHVLCGSISSRVRASCSAQLAQVIWRSVYSVVGADHVGGIWSFCFLWARKTCICTHMYIYIYIYIYIERERERVIARPPPRRPPARTQPPAVAGSDGCSTSN